MGKISSVFLLVTDWLLLISTRSGSPPLLVLKRLYIHLKTIRLYIVLGSQKNLLQTGTVLSICVKICKVGLEQIYPKKIRFVFFLTIWPVCQLIQSNMSKKKKWKPGVFLSDFLSNTVASNTYQEDGPYQPNHHMSPPLMVSSFRLSLSLSAKFRIFNLKFKDDFKNILLKFIF